MRWECLSTGKCKIINIQQREQPLHVSSVPCSVQTGQTIRQRRIRHSARFLLTKRRFPGKKALSIPSWNNLDKVTWECTCALLRYNLCQTHHTVHPGDDLSFANHSAQYRGRRLLSISSCYISASSSQHVPVVCTGNLELSEGEALKQG